MSGYIYCLFSIQDGIPRYVGRTDELVSHRFKQHITNALDQEPGPVYDWIRSVWREGHDIHFHTLQREIIPADIRTFENYWMHQFAGLTNVAGYSAPADHTETGRQVIRGIRTLLNLPALS